MAVITGLLELQEMMGQDPETALSESRARIKSMAIIHELLYKSNSFSDINIHEYLTELGKHLSLSISNIVSVQVQNSVSASSLNINQALPLALLLNELAFYVSQEAGNLNQQLELELQILSTNDKLCLQITSLKPGVINPAPINGSKEPTLRMSLIENLLAQIDGDLNMPQHGNLLIEIQFTPNIKKGSSSTLV
jgi:two-component sensor histidine kinase